jgi:hypothetical protein
MARRAARWRVIKNTSTAAGDRAAMAEYLNRCRRSRTAAAEEGGEIPIAEPGRTFNI